MLDTSVLVAAERGTFAMREFLDQLGAMSVGISAVTASEFLLGGHRESDPGAQSQRLARADSILHDLPLFDFGVIEARRHAELWARLRRERALLGPHEMLIAATALARGHQLATLNTREFRLVPGLRLVAVDKFVVRVAQERTDGGVQ